MCCYYYESISHIKYFASDSFKLGIQLHLFWTKVVRVKLIL